MARNYARQVSIESPFQAMRFEKNKISPGEFFHKGFYIT
jgi:hypothetical protein